MFFRLLIDRKWLSENVSSGDLVTVVKVIDVITRKDPSTTKGWYNNDGQLQTSLQIFVDGQNIQGHKGLETILRDGSELVIIPLIMGG
jgi:molybdopterin converting factor small subunit